MRRVGLVRRQHVDLRLVVHGVPQVQARAQLQVARLEAAFEQQDGAAPAERAHALRFVEVEQREAVGTRQPGIGTFDAVAVGIGLDHRPHARLRRGLACATQVVRQRLGVDERLDRSGHGAPILPARVHRGFIPGGYPRGRML